MANKNLWKQVQVPNVKRNVFDLTHDVKMSGRIGKLMPNLVLDCMPGDKVYLKPDLYVKFAQMLAPILHRVNIFQHYFFVPYRLLWDGWESFITNNEEDPRVYPYLSWTGGESADIKKFMDYLGVPPLSGGMTATTISAMFPSAYQFIYNEYYRDENLIAEVDYQLSDGSNDAIKTALCTQRLRAWEHDYFTSSLPWAQKGAAIELPLGDIVLNPDWYADGDYPSMINSSGAIGGDGLPLRNADQSGGSPAPNYIYDGTHDVTGRLAYDPDGSLEVQSPTINEFRRASVIQQFLEINARGGTRYNEFIRAHFNVIPEDYRLQRPEYITGVSGPVIISEVLNQSGPGQYFNTDTNEAVEYGDAVGSMAGHGTGVVTGGGKSYNVKEFGCIIGIVSIMPKTAYQQGIPKHWLKRDFLDFGFPTFANLGEQEVFNEEIYAGQPVPRGTFGYVPRYSEYKYMPSRVAGDFRTTLDYWHMGRIFGGAPSLNQQFIECDPGDVQRVFAVTSNTEDNIWMHVLHNIKAVRPLTFFGTPGIPSI